MKNLLIWLPRAIVIAYILFISTFALDAFEGDGAFFEKIGHFLLHLIPAAVTAGFLAVAWRVRILGGLLMLVLGLVFTINYRTDRQIAHFLMISMPLMLAGVLFIFSHWNAGKTRID